MHGALAASEIVASGRGVGSAHESTRTCGAYGPWRTSGGGGVFSRRDEEALMWRMQRLAGGDSINRG